MASPNNHQRLKAVDDVDAWDRQGCKLALDTKLGQLVKDVIMKFLEKVSLLSVLEFFVGPFLEDEVLKMAPFQRHRRGDQQTSCKVPLASGNHNDSLISKSKPSRKWHLPFMSVTIWARHPL